MSRVAYSARGRSVRTALHQAVAKTPKKVSVCRECKGKVRYIVGSTYGLWGHVGETPCTADPNTTHDRSQIRVECRHCTAPARDDGSDYADVCDQWPRCEEA